MIADLVPDHDMVDRCLGWWAVAVRALAPIVRPVSPTNAPDVQRRQVPSKPVNSNPDRPVTPDPARHVSAVTEDFGL